MQHKDKKKRNSCVTIHCLKFYFRIKWLHPKTLFEKEDTKAEKVGSNQKNKRFKCGCNKYNIIRDDDNLLKTNEWIPLLKVINDLEITLQTKASNHREYLTSN